MKNDTSKRTIAQDVRIAKDLLYSQNVIDALKVEKDPNKRNRILINARKGVIR